MVQFYRATTGEGGGWDREKNYRDISWGDEGTIGPTYTLSFKKIQFCSFERPPVFRYIRTPWDRNQLYTNGITGCAAICYVYWEGDSIHAVAMGHVNCGSYEKPNLGPVYDAKKRGYTTYTKLDVIVAHRSDSKYTETHSYLTEDGVDTNNIFDYYDPLLEDFVISFDGKIGRHAAPKDEEAKTASTSQGHGSKAKKGKCFLTTATCQALSLGEECAELETLRWFRDNVLAQTEGGRRDIDEYYRVAPRIVDSIDLMIDRLKVYEDLYRDLIMPSVAHIRARRYDDAHTLYRLSIEQLMRRFPE